MTQDLSASDPRSDLAFASIDGIRRMIAAREVSAADVVSAGLELIELLNPQVNAVVAVRAEAALAEARRSDQLAPEDRGLLHGIPFTVKDVIETTELPTTYGSPAFAKHRPSFDAVVVTRLQAAGAILVGKTNTPPFACEPVTRGELFGETINPWSPERTAGGSSGGAAAGLATGMFTLGQGTDAGGSNRIPASCCGVVGVKPTRGRVPFAPAAYEPWGGLLHSGPLARSVRDAAAMLDVMAGPAPGEPAVSAPPSSCRSACDLPLPPMRAAFSTEVRDGQLDEEVAVAFADALEVFGSLGLEFAEESPPWGSLAEPFTVIVEATFAGLASEMTEEQLASVGQGPSQLIERGRQIAAADYYVAQQHVRRRSAEMLAFWDGYDVLLTPTVPWVPPLRRTLPATEEYVAKWAQYGVWETFTSLANLTGQPALSLPCRKASRTEVPIGLQLIGRYGEEAELFTLAAAYERAAPWEGRRPALAPASRPGPASG